MKKIKPRIGIYGTVSPDSEIYKTLLHILGYDPFKVKTTFCDRAVSPFCGRAKTFGPHFTIIDIFTPVNYRGLKKELKKLAKKISPFEYSFSKISSYTRGDYQKSLVYRRKGKSVIALDFDKKSHARIKKLHELIIKKIQPYRRKIEPEFNKELFRKTPELWPFIKKYGAPYVLKKYSPHLSLASGLYGREKMTKKLIKHLASRYGKKLLNKPVLFDALYIFEEIKTGKYRNYFKVKEKISLS